MYLTYRATRLYCASWPRPDRYDIAGSSKPAVCGFCGADTQTERDRLQMHIERGGFTLCPAGGMTVAHSRQLQQRLNSNYALLGEER